MNADERGWDVVALPALPMHCWNGLGVAKYMVVVDGISYLSGTNVGWPQVANLDQQPVDALGRILARPSVEDLYDQFRATARFSR